MKGFHLDCKTISDCWFQLIYNIFDNNYRTEIHSGSFEKEQIRIQYPAVSMSIEMPYEDIVPQIPKNLGIPTPTSMEFIEDYFADYIMNPELGENETYKYATRIHQKLPIRTNIVNSHWHIIKDIRYLDDIIRMTTEIVPNSYPDHIHLVDGKIVCYKDLHSHEIAENSGETQYERVIRILKNTPLTNQAVISVSSPDDLEICHGNDGKLDPPCLRSIGFKVIPPNILTIHVYFRSWDLWAGLPSNLGGLELFKQLVAQETNLINGPMYGYSEGLHLYGYQEEIAKIRTLRK